MQRGIALASLRARAALRLQPRIPSVQARSFYGHAFAPLRPSLGAPLRPPSSRGYCTSVNLSPRDSIRNISVIAHVDHGKTTLVDQLLTQSGQKITGSRVMDNNEIEQERGITILAKNTSIKHGDRVINIVDTPGHADFSGEVERALQMVEGFILLVDAAEGPKPGTRYVLKKALELNLKPVVVINKVDRAKDSEIESTRDKIEMLFLELATNDDQLEYPVLYGSGKNGYMSDDPTARSGSLLPLLEALVETVPAPMPLTQNLQLLVTCMEVIGGKRIATGRLYGGTLKLKDEVFICDYHNPGKDLGSFKVQELLMFDGLERKPVEMAADGDIVCISGDALMKAGIKIGHTLCHKSKLEPRFYKPLDEPTFKITVHPNRSPAAGKDGKKFTGPEIRERLLSEAVRNLAMKLEIAGPDEFKLWGRGLLHLGVLFDAMRREGFELELSKPEVTMKMEGDRKMEPWELIRIRHNDDVSGEISQIMYSAHGEMKEQADIDGGWVESVFEVPARCILGIGSKVKAVFNLAEIEQEFLEYRPFDSSLSVARQHGSLLASGDGLASSDGLAGIKKHGVSFVNEKDVVYRGMVVGYREGNSSDLELNVTKASPWSKSNTTGMQLNTHTLESALEYIQSDELVEVTPATVRIRKKDLKKK
eukprot:Sspe_Gene.53183::Locus_29425_Transcript_2_2_Confidence_0.667_Length_2094::g.53183::m.53183/K06207/typA, bipA; GTP-binding protein